MGRSSCAPARHVAHQLCSMTNNDESARLRRTSWDMIQRACLRLTMRSSTRPLVRRALMTVVPSTTVYDPTSFGRPPPEARRRYNWLSAPAPMNWGGYLETKSPCFQVKPAGREGPLARLCRWPQWVVFCLSRFYHLTGWLQAKAVIGTLAQSPTFMIFASVSKGSEADIHERLLSAISGHSARRLTLTSAVGASAACGDPTACPGYVLCI